LVRLRFLKLAMASESERKLKETQEYYGKILQKSDDLKTNACCTEGMPPEHIAAALSNIHLEVIEKYYGCGIVMPDVLEGQTVVDLGCGAGRDVYTIAQLVGSTGKVIGVDMTPEQLEVARRHEDYHKESSAMPNLMCSSSRDSLKTWVQQALLMLLPISSSQIVC